MEKNDFHTWKIIISCVNYRTFHVKQPDVASGVRRSAWNETPVFSVLRYFDGQDSLFLETENSLFLLRDVL